VNWIPWHFPIAACGKAWKTSFTIGRLRGPYLNWAPIDYRPDLSPFERIVWRMPYEKLIVIYL
jgi:hypothetical protein